MSDSAIRVALVSRASATLHGPGGLERHVDDLACQLLERGVAVTLITRPASRTGAEADSENHSIPDFSVRRSAWDNDTRSKYCLSLFRLQSRTTGGAALKRWPCRFSTWSWCERTWCGFASAHRKSSARFDAARLGRVWWNRFSPD